MKKTWSLGTNFQKAKIWGRSLAGSKRQIVDLKIVGSNPIVPANFAEGEIGSETATNRSSFRTFLNEESTQTLPIVVKDGRPCTINDGTGQAGFFIFLKILSFS